jgi:N-acetylmuramoyl-L-alanine amidase
MTCSLADSGRMAGSRIDSRAQRLRRSDLDRRCIVRGLFATGLLPLLRAEPIHAAQLAETRPLIMLDPGHGGHDPGAIGVTGLYEKHVALATARELKVALEGSGRYRVGLTREDDVFIPLEQRVANAQAQDARLFISLHADALTDHSVRGASVYTLSARASDAQSDELAHRENSANVGPSEAFNTYSPDVANILESLAERETPEFSARLQQELVDSLSERTLVLHNPSRHADFVVLRSSDVPSVLVEMGFMSNEADETLLRASAHQKQVVRALQDGIEKCVRNFSILTQTG